jgi:hypothetical protein
MKKPFDQIEEQLQNLIEGGVARLFPETSRSKSLPDRLIKSMHEGLHPDKQGVTHAPNLYFIRLHPQDSALFESQNEILEGLSDFINTKGLESGYTFTSHPIIRIQPDPFLRQGEFAVTAVESQAGITPTSGIPFIRDSDSLIIPTNCFLIVDGIETFILNITVVNIGRREDNHLVIRDPRVSRLHAQIRAIRGKFSIFDLDSSTGTFVNGQSIKQHQLEPGDVILVGGTPLVFGQDPTGETGKNEVNQ